MSSIYHFFHTLCKKKDTFALTPTLEDFPFDSQLLSCGNVGQFPDLAIRINKDNPLFTGGELIELKDSDTYSVSSFNSTIPTGKKHIDKVVKSENSSIGQQMVKSGDDIHSLLLRDVFYLVRGRNKKRNSQKIALVHGSFFETIRTKDLISQSFSQVLDERLLQSGMEVSPEMKELLTTIFSEQENFSKVRNVDKASVKLRFRVMTEVKAEGNILNEKKYPEIKDNTLNFLIPYHTEHDKELAINKMNVVFEATWSENFEIFTLKHHFNGYFLVFQTTLL
jgi:hypothetical protein